MWEDDDNDESNFNAEDDFESNHEKLKKFPLYIKAMEILDTVDALSECMSESDKNVYSGILRESAMIIPAKIAGAFGSNSWLICMQNASIVRYHAEYLLSSTSGLKHFTKTDKNYVQVLRTDILDFQKLFIEWAKSFDSLKDDGYEDEWGLFKRK
ncbi:MAG: hypothetical protein ACXVO9_12815 [Bacteroidia bacterium]